MSRTGSPSMVAVLAAALGFNPVVAADPPAKPVSFIADVAPILKENCLACHDAKKKAGKFDLSTFDGLTAGGTNGEPIVPGKPQESELYRLIATTDERRMPPRDKGSAVARDKAAIIERWIREGAKLDNGIDVKAEIARELRARTKPPAPPEVYPFPAPVSALAFSPDGKKLVVGGHYELTVWQLPTASRNAPKLVQRVRTRAERTHGLAFLPDGKLVAAGGRPGFEGDVRILDLDAKPTNVSNGVAYLDGTAVDGKVAVKQLLDSDDSVLALALSADGKRLAAGGSDRPVRVWDLSGGAVAAKLDQAVENHADWVVGVALSFDGKHLFTASRDKSAKVWDLVNKQSVVTFADHQNPVNGVAVGEGGKVGYSIGSDRLIRSWKLDGDGKQLKSAAGHGDDILQIALSPKGSPIATASADKTIRLWDVSKSPAIASQKTLSGLTDFVYSLAFDRDGTRIAAGNYDGEVRIWNVVDGSVVAAFNASPGQRSKQATSDISARK